MNHFLLTRSYSSNRIQKSAKLIRNEFLDYFKKDLGHTFVRSSPVTPLNDHTVAFVNAGMNQFKGVFLDYYDPPATKVTNSQKCIRISGKHNDLSIIGNDTYHHTFFEMLGNWSFGSYFKEEACRYAWNLLTKHYGIKEEFLYVTYFAGDESLGLKPDLECKDIWLNIGVSRDKVLPFGAAENFWEMGISGPCGPCTEIHVDHTKQLTNRCMQINKGYTDLTELWNIVFIQYERLMNGTILPLSKHHVDTGMGFERLVALLQGKKSNYDTDLFQPLFKTIQKYANAPEYKGEFSNENNELDRAYRILVDHSRMITVALADGVVPEGSNKLRKIIRKTLNVSEQVFKIQGILPELSYIVAESLGDVYPELQANLKKVQKIIWFEEELYKKLQQSSGRQWKKMVQTRPQLSAITEFMAPGLQDGYKYLQRIINELKDTKVLPGDVAFKLYDTYGLSAETINELAKIESLRFDEDALKQELEDLRSRSRIGLEKSSELALRKCIETLEHRNVPKTDDSFKYKYIFEDNNYQFPQSHSKIVALIVNDNTILVNKANVSTPKDIGSTVFNAIANSDRKPDNINIGIVLDKTVCYSLEGGQASDKGFIRIGNLSLSINNVRKINDYVVHYGTFLQNDLKEWTKELRLGDECVVSIDPEFRLGLMQHHTAAHLLNASIRRIVQAVYPRNSLVLTHDVKLQYNSFGEKLSLERLKEIEKMINNVIRANVSVTTKILNALGLLAEDSVTLTPKEIYPHKGIRVVEIDSDDLKSKEACCGTHVFKTGELEHFCFLDYFSKGASNINVKAAVGSLAKSAKLAGENVQNKILNLQSKLEFGGITHEEFKSACKEIENTIRSDKETVLPYIIKEECLTKLKDLNMLYRVRTKDAEKLRHYLTINRWCRIKRNGDAGSSIKMILKASLQIDISITVLIQKYVKE